MLSPERVLRERAVFASFIYDVVPLPVAFYVAIMSGSLTMLGEVLRGVFLVSMAFLSWLTLRRIHRGRDGGYDFGLGKLEQVLSFLVALALCASIVFIWYKSLTRTGPFRMTLKRGVILPSPSTNWFPIHPFRSGPTAPVSPSSRLSRCMPHTN